MSWNIFHRLYRARFLSYKICECGYFSSSLSPTSDRKMFKPNRIVTNKLFMLCEKVFKAMNEKWITLWRMSSHVSLAWCICRNERARAPSRSHKETALAFLLSLNFRLYISNSLQIAFTWMHCTHTSIWVNREYVHENFPLFVTTSIAFAIG